MKKSILIKEIKSLGFEVVKLKRTTTCETAFRSKKNQRIMFVTYTTGTVRRVNLGITGIRARSMYQLNKVNILKDGSYKRLPIIGSVNRLKYLYLFLLRNPSYYS